MFLYDTRNCPAAYPEACCVFLPGLSVGAIGCLLGLFSDVSQDTAVYVKYMSVYEVGSIGCQEYSRSLQICGVSPTCGRSLCNNELIEGMSASIRLDFTQGRSLGCGNIAGPNAVALNVVFAIFGCNISGEHLQTA